MQTPGLPEPAPDDPAATERPLATYAHRARPVGGETAFRLFPDRLAVSRGQMADVLPLADIKALRLLYRPRNSTHEGYQAKLARRGRPGLALTNLSWRNLVQVERRDAEYQNFVEKLTTALAAANPAATLHAGMPAWLYAVNLAAGAAALAAFVLVMIEAARSGSWPLALGAVLAGLYLGWWTWRYLWRNRPRTFTAEAIPPEMLPAGRAAD